MVLKEKSFSILELPSVLSMLAAEAASEPAREEALSITPSADVFEVRRRLAETSAAKTMMSVGGSPGFSGLRNVSGALARADAGGMLNTMELLDIAGVLRAARNAKTYASGDRQEKTAISYLFLSLKTNKALEEKITTSILGENEISDSASSELYDIRRHMRLAAEKVRQSLQKIISSPAYSKILQEPIITQRSDRYVVPVKSEHRSSMPGLVHDVSSSGATLFIEPMSVVQANNEIRELEAKEKKEIERILMELSADAAADKDGILCDCDVLVKLDVVFAKAKLSYKLDAIEPEISENGAIVLKKARHPLLEQKTAVPIDICLGGEYDTLVITGPNTGGKTVTLKTTGLLCLMAACGLHIPASDGSCVPVFEKVLADIGDEQSIEQSLSTFSAHMTNIVRILDECDTDSLLLFDELGAGTDPTEGAALAVSIIEFARKMGSKVAATTHYSELKVYATTTPGVQNASCEFDVETLRPTYKLLIGIPGKSNAFAIASRLGISDEVIKDARSRIDAESASFEEVLESLEKSRQEMEKEKLETRLKLREAEKKAQDADKMFREAKVVREKAEERARREAARILDDARSTADRVMDELTEIRKKQEKSEDWNRLNSARAELRRRLNETEERLAPEREAPEPESPKRPIKAGDRVELIGIGSKAEVISVGADGTLNLQAGIMKITAKPGEVRLLEGQQKPEIKKYLARSEAKLRNLNVSPEVDLRGMTAEEAIDVMERYIDTASLAKLTTVTVIHGKGTGALRQAVQQSLRRNKQVKEFRLGKYGEGETGVTVVTLK